MDFPWISHFYMPLAYPVNPQVRSLGPDSGLVAVDGCHAATHRGCGGCGDSLVRCGSLRDFLASSGLKNHGNSGDVCGYN